jgi:hypothetical protein
MDEKPHKKHKKNKKNKRKDSDEIYNKYGGFSRDFGKFDFKYALFIRIEVKKKRKLK